MIVAHVGLAVRDLSRMVPFYCDLLGGELLYQSGAKASDQLNQIFALRDVKTMNAFVKMQGVTIEMIQIASPDLPDEDIRDDYRSRGWKHLALAVDDVESECRRLEAAGVTLRFPIQTIGTGGDAKMCYVDDPEGNIVEIIQRPPYKRPWD